MNSKNKYAYFIRTYYIYIYISSFYYIYIYIFKSENIKNFKFTYKKYIIDFD